MKKLKYEIKEVLGTVSPTEDLKTRFVKEIVRTLWDNQGHLEEGIDIRRFDDLTKQVFGGIRLTIEEAHKVCDILLEQGYGSTAVIANAYKERISVESIKKEGCNGESSQD